MQYLGHTFKYKMLFFYLKFKCNWCPTFYLATLGGWDLSTGVFLKDA